MMRFILLLHIIFFHLPSIAQLTQGPNNPAVASNVACSFSYSSALGLSPAGNVFTSNNGYAQANHCACCDANTNCLRVTDFGFSIPLTAVITGIRVEIERRGSFGSIIQDNGLRLLKAGVEVGVNNAAFGVTWPYTDGYAIYGGCNNLWGTSWTPSEINANNFGLVFACIDYTCGGVTTSFVDHIRITVCYDNTLPVELINFNAILKENKQVLLIWTTLSENNNHQFIIKKSTNGIEYQEIGNISANAHSNTEKEYFFIDDQTLQTDFVYYLLTQQDINGTEKNYGPVAVKKNIKDPDKINITNHNGTINFEIYSLKNCRAIITIYNNNGQAVYSNKVVIGNNFYAGAIDVSSFSEGIYIFSIASDNGVFISQKFVK